MAPNEPNERREGCAAEAVVFAVVVVATIAAVATGHLLAGGMLLGAGAFACALGPARRANREINDMPTKDEEKP